MVDRDEKVRNSFRAKLQSYNILKTTAPMSAGAAQFAATDKSENDRNDTIICTDQYCARCVAGGTRQGRA